MNQIINKTKCCGCTACCYVCPKKCISMEPDDEGFLYPVVNEKICIQCGLCEKVCPVKHPAPNEEYTRQARILRCKDEQVLAFSTSGGLFVPLSKYILSQGGVVCAAGYDECFNVLHQIIEPEMWNEKTYQRFVGSKYVQSDMGESFRKIKIILEEKRKVLFWGTPCQVNGLKTYLHKKYENLITVDLVCHGTPSPKLWRKYLDYQVERYGSGIKEISFRNKKYGYHAGRMRIVFNNGKEYFASSKSDYMLKSFFSEISSRPSCYFCPFKGVKRCSDLTVYDCWHFSQLTKNNDDDKGYTNVIVQTESGAKILEQLKEFCEIYLTDIDKAIQLDGVMVEKSAIAHPKRKEFYVGMDFCTLGQHIEKFIPISLKDKYGEKLKNFLFSVGLMQWIKKRLRE